jgi:hypothetical protein
MQAPPRRRAMLIARTRATRSDNCEGLRFAQDVAFGAHAELVLGHSGAVLTVYPAAMTLPETDTRLAALPSPRNVDVRDVDDLPTSSLQSDQPWCWDARSPASTQQPPTRMPPSSPRSATRDAGCSIA